MLEFKQAVRKSSPMIIGLAGVSGSGKTLSAILMAAGIAGDKGKVGFIDTENGRGSMYADSPLVKKALPGGYLIGQLDPPFSPAAYVEAIKSAEAAGVTVLVIDSGSHEWEGTGGCSDIAENNKLRGMPNWAKAKMEHKKLMNHLLTTNMNIIICLRAREKTKIQKDEKGKEQFIEMGVQPIAEKSFVFELTLSLQLDEKTHFANPIKVPEPLAHLFKEARLLTVEDGAKIRQWNQTGAVMDPAEQLAKRAKLTAENGMAEYEAFWKSLTPAQRTALASVHESNKKIAKQADQVPVFGTPEKPDFIPADFTGARCILNGEPWHYDQQRDEYVKTVKETAN